MFSGQYVCQVVHCGNRSASQPRRMDGCAQLVLLRRTDTGQWCSGESSEVALVLL